MATINLLDHKTAEILIFSAVVAASEGKLDLVEMYKIERDAQGAPIVEVKLLVNGVEAPIVEALCEAWARLQAQFNREVEAKAKELILFNSSLDDLSNKISDASYQLNRLVDDLLSSTIKEPK